MVDMVQSHMLLLIHTLAAFLIWTFILMHTLGLVLTCCLLLTHSLTWKKRSLDVVALVEVVGLVEVKGLVDVVGLVDMEEEEEERKKKTKATSRLLSEAERKAAGDSLSSCRFIACG